MGQYADGQYIELWFDDYDHPEYVKGHVTPDLVCQVLKSHGIDPNDLAPPTHAYARWSMEQSDWENGRHVLREFKDRGWGRFSVTVFETLDDLCIRMMDAFMPLWYRQYPHYRWTL